MEKQARKTQNVNFTAIDFETANWRRASACSIGMVKVRDGEIVDKFYSLIKPDPFEFSPINSRIHGIKMEDCTEAPTFAELLPTIKDWLHGQIIVAHNAPFEKSILNHLQASLGIDLEIKDYLCSMYLCQVAYHHLDKYDLKNICSNVLGKELNHHHAYEDALASAELTLSVVNSWLPPDFARMVNAIYDRGENKSNSQAKDIPLSTIVREPGYENRSELKGKKFAFTGKLNGFTREEAAQLVVNYGGTVSDNFTKSSNILVAGQYNSNLGKDFQSGKLKKAMEAIEEGKPISIISDSEFIDLINNLF